MIGVNLKWWINPEQLRPRGEGDTPSYVKSSLNYLKTRVRSQSLWLKGGGNSLEHPLVLYQKFSLELWFTILQRNWLVNTKTKLIGCSYNIYLTYFSRSVDILFQWISTDIVVRLLILQGRMFDYTFLLEVNCTSQIKNPLVWTFDEFSKIDLNKTFTNQSNQTLWS